MALQFLSDQMGMPDFLPTKTDTAPALPLVLSYDAVVYGQDSTNGGRAALINALNAISEYILANGWPLYTTSNYVYLSVYKGRQVGYVLDSKVHLSSADPGGLSDCRLRVDVTKFDQNHRGDLITGIGRLTKFILESKW